jgi:hypothetical protein
MPSATKKRHLEEEKDNAVVRSKKGHESESAEDGAEETEEEAESEEGAWRDRVSSASLRAACVAGARSARDAAATVAAFDPCAAASAREQAQRDKRQRRAGALETLWRRLKVCLRRLELSSLAMESKQKNATRSI